MTTDAAPPAAPATEDIAALLGNAPRPWWRRPATGLGALLLAALVVGLSAWLGDRDGAQGPAYVTEPVVRGALRVVVNATGTLQPTRTVNIGSELSGTVTRVRVDVNDRVRRGQPMVELDAARFRDQVAKSRAALASAEAGVAQAAATLTQARAQRARYEEVARLSGGKVPSKAELDDAAAALERARADEAAARAAVAGARATLSTDETNLAKAAVRAPLDGVVLTRSVDPGNAVAASLQAVTLFTVAEDLRRLKLEVNVDEADVGGVQVGQPAEFSVSAWPNRRFPARITRVAYGSRTTDNVVTYTTQMDVDNDDLSLRPGMTASATITAVEHADVLMVPNTALRFTPSAGPAAASAPGGLVSRLLPRPPPGPAKRPPAAAGGPGQRQVWVLRPDGHAEAVAVAPGLSDGRRTEVQAAGLQAGDAVIVDQQRSAAPR